MFCLIFACIFLLQNISLYKNCILIIYMMSLNMLSESIMRSIKPLADSTCHLECCFCGLTPHATESVASVDYTRHLQDMYHSLEQGYYLLRSIPVCKSGFSMGKSFNQSASLLMDTMAEAPNMFTH